MRNFYAARPHFPQKWGENHNFSCQIFSIQKNHLLRPRFLKSPGSEDTIFPYRYFWHTNLQFFARISWKIGSVHKFFLHRPRAVHSPTSGLYVGGSHSCETAIQWIDVKAAHSANLWILKIYWKKVVDFWKKVLTAIWVCGKLIWLSEIIDSETQKTKESFRKLKITLDNILNTW